MSLDWQPLGDQALLAYCADENTAWRWASVLRNRGFAWVVDIVQAYTSVAVFIDADQIDLLEAKERLSQEKIGTGIEVEPRSFVVPCCYELGLDLERVAQHQQLSIAEVIALHTSRDYTVYAIGFCPGFPYLGYLPEGLTGVPRLPSPRLRVEAGSVGLTGRQTGIYTEPRPGGWNIIGRTPLDLVNVAEGYFPLRTGDRVRFERIDEKRFRELEGRRLE